MVLTMEIIIVKSITNDSALDLMMACRNLKFPSIFSRSNVSRTIGDIKNLLITELTMKNPNLINKEGVLISTYNSIDEVNLMEWTFFEIPPQKVAQIRLHDLFYEF
jgi:hypothetical protein